MLPKDEVGQSGRFGSSYMWSYGAGPYKWPNTTGVINPTYRSYNSTYNLALVGAHLVSLLNTPKDSKALFCCGQHKKVAKEAALGERDA